MLSIHCEKTQRFLDHLRSCGDSPLVIKLTRFEIIKQIYSLKLTAKTPQSSSNQQFSGAIVLVSGRVIEKNNFSPGDSSDDLLSPNVTETTGHVNSFSQKGHELNHLGRTRVKMKLLKNRNPENHLNHPNLHIFEVSNATPLICFQGVKFLVMIPTPNPGICFFGWE